MQIKIVNGLLCLIDSLFSGGRGGRGGGRGGRGGMKGGSKVVVEPHRHEGIFVARGKEDALVTLNSTPGVAVYGEKRISVETPSTEPGGAAVKTEYRVWNPFRSKSKWNEQSGDKSIELK